MANRKKPPKKVEEEVRSKLGQAPLTDVLRNMPMVANHLGADRALLIAVSAIFVGGLALRVGTFDLMVTEALILSAWAMGKVFKWF